MFSEFQNVSVTFVSLVPLCVWGSPACPSSLPLLPASFLFPLPWVPSLFLGFPLSLLHLSLYLFLLLPSPIPLGVAE